MNPEYVQDIDDAFQAVDDTMTELHQKGVLKTKVHETKRGEPVEMTFHIADEEEVEVARPV
jgi:PDZ domain-containing secreted protein